MRPDDALYLPDGDPDRAVRFIATPWTRGPWDMQILKDGWKRANQVIAVDLDGDGRLDLVASAEEGSNEVRWWRNGGSRWSEV